jgi:hypothetical protein
MSDIRRDLESLTSDQPPVDDWSAGVARRVFQRRLRAAGAASLCLVAVLGAGIAIGHVGRSASSVDTAAASVSPSVAPEPSAAGTVAPTPSPTAPPTSAPAAPPRVAAPPDASPSATVSPPLDITLAAHVLLSPAAPVVGEFVTARLVLDDGSTTPLVVHRLGTGELTWTLCQSVSNCAFDDSGCQSMAPSGPMPPAECADLTVQPLDGSARWIFRQAGTHIVSIGASSQYWGGPDPDGHYRSAEAELTVDVGPGPSASATASPTESATPGPTASPTESPTPSVEPTAAAT